MDLAYKSEDAVVLASGGQDSTTCLAWAKKHFNKVYAISFFYGQKHSVENEIAQKIDNLQLLVKIAKAKGNIIKITFIYVFILTRLLTW